MLTRQIKKVVHIIGGAIKEGQTGCDGTELNPQTLRDAGLLKGIAAYGWVIKDQGQISSLNLKGRDYGPDHAKGIINIRQLGDMLHWVHKKNIIAAEDKGFALNLGGDHSISTGSISGLKSMYPNMKVLWISAHDDCVLPEFSNQKYRNYHGMSASHLLGWINEEQTPNFQWLKRPVLNPQDICFVEGEEKMHLNNFQIKHYTPDHIQRYGLGKVLEKSLEYLQADKNPLYLSFDITGVDASVAPGASTKCKEGLSYRDAMYVCRRAFATTNLVGMDLTEINPLLDKIEEGEKLFGDDPYISGSQTVALGCQLILSSMGKVEMPFMAD